MPTLKKDLEQFASRYIRADKRGAEEESLAYAQMFEHAYDERDGCSLEAEGGEWPNVVNLMTENHVVEAIRLVAFAKRIPSLRTALEREAIAAREAQWQWTDTANGRVTLGVESGHAQCALAIQAVLAGERLDPSDFRVLSKKAGEWHANMASGAKRERIVTGGMAGGRDLDCWSSSTTPYEGSCPESEVGASERNTALGWVRRIAESLADIDAFDIERSERVAMGEVMRAAGCKWYEGYGQLWRVGASGEARVTYACDPIEESGRPKMEGTLESALLASHLKALPSDGPYSDTMRAYLTRAKPGATGSTSRMGR